MHDVRMRLAYDGLQRRWNRPVIGAVQVRLGDRTAGECFLIRGTSIRLLRPRRVTFV